MRIKSKVDVMRTEYNTDDANNPKEIATLYNVFEYVDGNRSDTLYFMSIIRQRSRIVFKQEYGRDLFSAMQQYHRTIRGRAQEWHPIAVEVQKMERIYGSGAYEP